MYCPRCSQQQVSQQTRFCSRCGFLMAGMDSIVANGGVTPEVLASFVEERVSPKIRGLKQGGIMFLSGMIIVPVLAIISGILDVEPVLAAFAAVLLFWGGILRMIYALIFQSGKKTLPENAGFVESLKQNFVGDQKSSRALDSAYQQPAPADFQPASMNWRDTSDLDSVPRDQNATTTFSKE